MSSSRSPGTTQLLGSDGATRADVELISGKNRLLTDATVTVEQLLGNDPIPDSWFRIIDTGAEDDTWTISVAATTADPSSPDRDVAAYSKVFTVQASEVGDEIALRDRIVTELNSDTNFKNAYLKANKVTDRAVVHVTSTKYSLAGEFYERPNAGDFNVEVTGSADVQIGFNTLESRGKATSLARDPDNPHKLGILGISGSVSVTPGEISQRVFTYAMNGGSSTLLVNGSVTPVIFSVDPIADFDIYVTQIRFFGGGNGIKYGQFLSKGGTLTTGIQVDLKSDDSTFSFEKIKSSEDFKNVFSAPNTADFRIDVQSGADQFIAIFQPSSPFPLRATGTFTTDDYIKVTVNDDISSGISSLKCAIIGFKKEV